jgi:biotin synthase
VEVFGDGNVGSNLIVGLGETEREAAELIQRLHDMKVKTVLFAFTPLAGTRLEGLPPPQMEKYRRLQAARHLIVNGHATMEDLSFEGGRITGYGGLALESVLGDGVAFMTTGCPSCNRPFYNERPSGPFYNYPRPLTEEEIRKELAILKT